MRPVRTAMAGHHDHFESAESTAATAISLTARQAEVLQLAVQGLSGKQIAHQLGISVRTVEDHFHAMRRRTGAHSQGELIAYGTAAGLVRPGGVVPDTVLSGTPTALPLQSAGEICPGNRSRNGAPPPGLRVGYARVSIHRHDNQAQLDALTAAHCREIIVETASIQDAQPKLDSTLAALEGGDTLVIYKLNRMARSLKELLILLEDQLHIRGINLHILAGVCAGLHRPDGKTIADRMLFIVAAMAAEMERDLIRERTLDEQHAVSKLLP